jgi:lipoate-protein ligase A
MRWYLLDSGRGAPAENMALDEALLEAAPRIGCPVLRFYGWTEAAATFGYFQKFAEVERLTKLRPLIRRPTGGGVVPHDADWTYSLMFPPGDPWYQLKAVESYRRVHEWIQTAWRGLGTATELAPFRRRESPGECFIGAEQFDVLWKDKKIAGAAQRRTRGGLLIQGSIQPPVGAGRSEFEQAFCGEAAERWGVEWQELVIGAQLQNRSREVARVKYSTREFNEKR